MANLFYCQVDLAAKLSFGIFIIRRVKCSFRRKVTDTLSLLAEAMVINHRATNYEYQSPNQVWGLGGKV